MSKQTTRGVGVLVGVFACIAFASLLLAQGAVAPFHITSHDPLAHEVGVALTETVQATFSDDVDSDTVSNDTFVLHGHLGGLAIGDFKYDDGTLTLMLYPKRQFHTGEVLRVSATSGISSTGRAGLTPFGWQFTAGPVRDRRFGGFADIGAGLTGTYFSSVAWGDYDNDDDLDILVTGHDGSNPASGVYRNDGAGAFSDIGAGLVGVYDGSVAWGDYDNDGDLDILLTGCPGGDIAVSKLYRNNGGGAFSDTGAGLTDAYASSVAWGDYDNDGDLDILLSGSGVSSVYRNDGGATFTDIGAGLSGVWFGSVAWGDYDNDGDLDILLTGMHGTVPVSRVYRNDGAGVFSDIGAGLTDVYGSSVAWGDYDNDGDLDILLTGYDGSSLVSRVYCNDGSGGFTDVGAGLTGVFGSSVAWGDYDSDGDLDILLTGYDGSNPTAKVYRNDGGAGFADTGAGLPGVYYSSVAWGDVDNDGDLDILLAGTVGVEPGFDSVCKVYRNNSKPELGSVTPASGSGPVAATTYFTTTWSDPDGWQNLKQCYFHIGDSPSIVGSVTLMYNAAKNKLWLRSDAGSAWTGGHAPGTPTIMENSQAIVHCSLTTAQGAGETLSMTWAVEFKPGFEGAKKLGLKCKDRDKAKAKGKWKGTWTVTSS